LIIKEISKIKKELCRNCGFCHKYLSCLDNLEECTGCGACVEACPGYARYLKSERVREKIITIIIDKKHYEFNEQITILKALEKAGYTISHFHGEGHVHAPCRTGGCWSCAVLVDGELKPSCVTPIRNGMSIDTGIEAIEEHPPLRMVASFEPHTVGGVGTPHWVKKKSLYAATPRYTEIVAFTQGCILRCPSCQNWPYTYASRGTPLTPVQTAKILESKRQAYHVERITLSGGECTLNNRWLIELLENLRKLCPPEVHLHIDTSTAMLTTDYIDQLVAAGMTDIGLDIKAARLETFAKISGLSSSDLTRRLLQQTWSSVEYLLEHYRDRIFIGIGIVYNNSLITIEEVQEIASRLLAIDPSVQVCLLDYRPEFRRLDLKKPSPGQMLDVWKLLKGMGLEYVTCQTSAGFFGP